MDSFVSIVPVDKLDVLLDKDGDKPYLTAIWAKTNMSDPSDTRWMSLPQHLADTMLVAERYWDDCMPEQTKRIFSKCFASIGDEHTGPDNGKRMYMFLAGIHDVGKATPAFENQVSNGTESGRERMNALESCGFDIDFIRRANSHALRHETASFNALYHWVLDSVFNSDTNNKEKIQKLASIIGGHHGMYHSTSRYMDDSLTDEYGNGLIYENDVYDVDWNDIRRIIIDMVSDCTDAVRILRSIDMSSLDASVQPVLSGAIVPADWIASSLPLLDDGTMPDSESEMGRVDSAWDNLSLSHPWNPIAPDRIPFSKSFGLPDSSRPNDVQRTCLDMAKKAYGPFAMIVEAPMGMGKTEAALLAASQAASDNGSGGLVIALPTQATANSMFSRLIPWARVQSLYDGYDLSVKLQHGKADFYKDYANMKAFRYVHADNVFSDGLQSGDVYVDNWFDGSKQGLLADFVICTVDQILKIALKHRYYNLKHFGLSGKTIIIDEIHAYDAYMSEYLERALEWLGGIGCTVIMLSATLPDWKRRSMLEAWSRGRSDSYDDELQLPEDDGYPMVSMVYGNRGIQSDVEIVPASNLKKANVRLQWTNDVFSDVTGLLKDGGCGCIIRNTVSEAQADYVKALSIDGFDKDNVILFHSRFTPDDRSDIERTIMKNLGRKSIAGDGRPDKLLVIGTQVLEQSLDIDFDVMGSDLAPVDLILQRMGRLHRHERSYRPESLETPVLYIEGRQKGSLAGEMFKRSSASIYTPWLLLKTVHALSGLESITIPDDIKSLVDRVYMDVIEESESDEYLQLEEKYKDEYDEDQKSMRERASRYMLKSPYELDCVSDDPTDGLIESEDDSKPQVRDSDGGIEVIVLKSDDEHALSFVSRRYDELVIPSDSSLNGDTGVSRMVASQTVSLPRMLSGKWIANRTIDWLERHHGMDVWHSNPLLRGKLAIILDGDGRTVMDVKGRNGTVERYGIEYDSDTGLSVDKR